MINAKDELLRHIEGRKVLVVHVTSNDEDDEYFDRRVHFGNVRGTLAGVLSWLDFEYDEGYGSQNIRGYIWYADGTWSERTGYDGAECWSHKSRRPLPTGFNAV
jgi:hypothetical protein